MHNAPYNPIPKEIHLARNVELGTFEVLAPAEVTRESVETIRFQFRPALPLGPDAGFLLLYEARQDAGVVQAEDRRSANYISARVGDEALTLLVHSVDFRTLDLYPEVPEFHIVTEHRVATRPIAAGEVIEIEIAAWKTPVNPIRDFGFWLIVDADARIDLAPEGFRSYRVYVDRNSRERTDPARVIERMLKASIEVSGEFPAVPVPRKVDGVYFGEIHGMGFNQRPFDEFYEYGRHVSHIDFCAMSMFSYSTCVENVWEQVKAAAVRHTVPGRFVALVAFEAGTPPDDSHRVVYFPEPTGVPPLFCDSRPPAQDPFIQTRFHPDTVYCKTLDEFYATIARYGGFVTGHMHTLRYEREVLGEIWQKRMWRGNPFNEQEEERIYEVLRGGVRFGLTAGSDTHDSMPGNPYGEYSVEIPGGSTDLEGPAGYTGVRLDYLDTANLTEALLARRVWATSGARIVLDFESNGQPMGSELPADAERRFRLLVDGTAPLARVELLRDGRPHASWSPNSGRFEAEHEDQAPAVENATFYLLRCEQQDGYKAWSSPIWFG